MWGSHFEEKKANIKKKVIPMESTKIPKRVIKKRLKNVDKAIAYVKKGKIKKAQIIIKPAIKFLLKQG